MGSIRSSLPRSPLAAKSSQQLNKARIEGRQCLAINWAQIDEDDISSSRIRARLWADYPALLAINDPVENASSEIISGQLIALGWENALSQV